MVDHAENVENFIDEAGSLGGKKLRKKKVFVKKTKGKKTKQKRKTIKGTKKKGKAGKWIAHVKSFAKSHKIKFPDALKHPDCKKSYKKM